MSKFTWLPLGSCLLWVIPQPSWPLEDHWEGPAELSVSGVRAKGSDPDSTVGLNISGTFQPLVPLQRPGEVETLKASWPPSGRKDQKTPPSWKQVFTEWVILGGMISYVDRRTTHSWGGGSASQLHTCYKKVVIDKASGWGRGRSLDEVGEGQLQAPSLEEGSLSVRIQRDEASLGAHHSGEGPVLLAAGYAGSGVRGDVRGM